MECSELETPGALGSVQRQVSQASASMRGVHFSNSAFRSGVEIVCCEAVVAEIEGENSLGNDTLSFQPIDKGGRGRVQPRVSQGLFISYNSPRVLDPGCILHTAGQ